MNRSQDKRRTGRRRGYFATVLADTLVWQPGPAVPPLTIELTDYFRDVTDEG